MNRHTTYTVYFVDYTGGKNRDKSYGNMHPVVLTTESKEELIEFINEKYPTAYKLVPFSDKTKEYCKHRADDNFPLLPSLEVYWSQSHALANQCGYGIESYGFKDKLEELNKSL